MVDSRKSKTTQWTSNFMHIELRNIFWPLLCTFAFSASTLLSGYGIYKSLADTPLPANIQIAVAVVITSILSILAFLSWRAIGNKLLRFSINPVVAVLATLIFLPVAFVAASGSIVTSFSASIFLMQGEDIQNRLNVQRFSNVTSPVALFNRNFTTIAFAASDLSQSAYQVSQTESKLGGTCGPSAPGAGPITDLRAQHSSEAAQFANQARALSNESGILTNQLVGATTQTEVNAIYAQVKSLLNDPRRTQLIRWAKVTRDSFESGKFNNSGQPIFCRDLEMASDLNELIKLASIDLELPPVTPLLRSASVFDSITISVERIANMINGNSDQSDYAILPFIIFSVLLDSIGGLSALILGLGGDKRRALERAKEYYRINWALRHLVWQFENKATYILVPLNGKSDMEFLAEKLVATLNVDLRPDFFRWPLVELRKVVPDLYSHFVSMTGHATHAHSYKLDKKAMKRLENLKRKTIDELEFAYKLNLSFGDLPSEQSKRSNWPDYFERPDLRLVPNDGDGQSVTG